MKHSGPYDIAASHFSHVWTARGHGCLLDPVSLKGNTILSLLHLAKLPPAFAWLNNKVNIAWLVNPVDVYSDRNSPANSLIWTSNQVNFTCGCILNQVNIPSTGKFTPNGTTTSSQIHMREDVFMSAGYWMEKLLVSLLGLMSTFLSEVGEGDLMCIDCEGRALDGWTKKPFYSKALSCFNETWNAPRRSLPRSAMPLPRSYDPRSDEGGLGFDMGLF